MKQTGEVGSDWPWQHSSKAQKVSQHKSDSTDTSSVPKLGKLWYIRSCKTRSSQAALKMSSTDETGETDKTVKLLGISCCEQQRWQWTITVPDYLSEKEIAFSSFESKWMLKMTYSSHRIHSLDLCLIGPENAKISYKITTRYVTEQDASVSEAKPQKPYITGLFEGTETFVKNSSKSLYSSRESTYINRGHKIIITIVITTDNVVTIPCNTFGSNIESAIKDNEEFQDTTLIVGQEDDKEEIKANKFMLMAQSTVFARMFKVDMKENNTNVVEIPNVSPRVFKAVLSYIYRGQVNEFLDLDETVSMMDFATQYELKHLQALCENRLAILLNTENAAHILVIADIYTCTKLKRKAVAFITQTSDMCRDVMKTEGWKALCENRLAILLNTENAAHILVFADKYTADKYTFTKLKYEAIVFIKQRCRDVMKTEGWKEMSKSLVEEVLTSIVDIDIDPKRQKLS